MGFLAGVAGGFAIAVPQAGYIVSAYAHGVVVGAIGLLGVALSAVFAPHDEPEHGADPLLTLADVAAHLSVRQGISAFV